MVFMFGMANDLITVLEIMGKDPNEKGGTTFFSVL